jgi:hypothetical protein
LVSAGGVVAFIVLVVEPRGERFSVFLIASEGLPVGPFGLQGLVESFHFPVLPEAVWTDEHLFDPSRVQQLGLRVYDQWLSLMSCSTRIPVSVKAARARARKPAVVAAVSSSGISV